MPISARLLICAALKQPSARTGSSSCCLGPNGHIRQYRGGAQIRSCTAAGAAPAGQRWTKSSEGRILAVSRPGKSESQGTIGGIPGAPVRTSFAKIREPLEVPNLLALQTESFDWLVGNAAWKERQAREAESSGLGALSGLEEILGEISPIEDFSGSMSLSFSSPRFEDVKASIEECKDKDMTYAAPLFVTAEFTNNTTGEIKSQTVFMGDFPMMTRKGTFVINGTERVVVSQLVRSPGIYFDRSLDKTSDVDVFSVKVIPSRGAWLEFDVDKRSTVGVRDRPQAPPAGHRAAQGARLELGPDPRALRLVGDAAGHPGEGPHPGPGRGAARHLPQAAAGRAPDQGVGAGAAGEPVLQPQALRPGQGGPLQGQQEARGQHRHQPRQPDRGRHRQDHRVPGPAARRRGRLRGRRHRSLRQPAAAYGRRADPEPDPGRPVPDGAGRPRADDHPGRRGDHAADPDQHPPRGGLDQGVLRDRPAVAVHGPDQPARRSDPQAPAVRARPRWPVARPGRHGGP